MQALLQQTDRFLDRRLPLRARLLLLISAFVIAAAIFAPLWQIHMVAPQYQEGLDLTIYAHKIVGGNGGQDLKEINNLNHYIGMRPIRAADFTEMQWIPFALGIFALLSLRAVVFGRVRSVVDVFVLFVYFAGFSFWRFYYRLYTYAHDLDPRAPMDIEPFTPALIGKNVIANFTQYSYPMWGSALLLAYMLLLAGAMWMAQKERGGQRL